MPIWIGGKSLSHGTGGGAGGDAAFDFDPATARYSFTGDSITALDDDTGFLYWATALAGGPHYMPPYGHQGVSGSEINEGVVASNPSDLLYPTRKQLLVDTAQSGDITAIAIGTNTIAAANDADIIAGLTDLYQAVLAKGGFVEAWTILPSASNIAHAARATVNAWIMALPTTGVLGYPGSRFIAIDGDAAWGGTYVGHTDSGDLHPNTLGALKLGRAKRAAYKAAGRAYCPLAYGVTNPADNLLANWNLAAASAGTLTGSGTLTNNGVPTGIAVANAIAGLTIVAETVTGYTPADSLYATVAAFPVLKLTVTGTSSEVTDKDITITMTQSIASEAAGSAYEASCYSRWKGVAAAADPTGLFAMGFTYGSVAKWAGQNSSKLTNFTDITLGDEGFLRARSTPSVQAFGSSSIVKAIRVRAGQAVSFEIYFGQPYAAKRERVAYAIPKSLNTDQDSIGGARATGPQVGTSNTSFAVSNGVALTGRPGFAWFGGGLTFQFTWEKLAVDGVTVSTLVGPTTVTTTASTTQYTPSGLVTGEKVRLKVTASNTFGSGDAYSVWSNAHA